MFNLLVRLFGWSMTVLSGDFFVFDRWRWLRGHLESGSKRTLDAGAGSGAYSIYAAKKGNEVVAITFQEEEIEKGRTRAALSGVDVEFVQGDLRALRDIQDELGTFDQVICCEVIEHLADDQQLVSDLAALIRPGGTLMLTTPNVDHRPQFKEMERHRWKEDGGHVRYGYSHERLREICDAAGLDVVDKDGVGGMLSQWFTSLMGVLVYVLRLPWSAAWLIMFPMRILNPIDRPLTRLFGYEFVSVAIVARRQS